MPEKPMADIISRLISIVGLPIVSIITEESEYTIRRWLDKTSADYPSPLAFERIKIAYDTADYLSATEGIEVTRSWFTSKSTPYRGKQTESPAIILRESKIRDSTTRILKSSAQSLIDDSYNA